MKNLKTSTLLLFLVLTGFFFFTQLQCQWPYLEQAYKKGDFQALFREVVSLAMGQGIHFLFAAIFTVIFYHLRNYTHARLAVFLVSVFALIYSAADQQFFKVFGSHIQTAFPEMDVHPGQLLDSLPQYFDRLFGLNLCLVFILGWILWKQLRPPQTDLNTQMNTAKIRKASLLGCIYLFGSLLFITLFSNNHRLSIPPLIDLALLSIKNNQHAPTREFTKFRPDLFLQKYGDENYQEESPIVLEPYRSLITNRKPNLIFITLESIGGKNILNNGLLDSTLTPTIYQNRKHLISFPTLQNSYPGTTRSHLTINTGGYALSWGNYAELMAFKFKGTTLTEAFNKSGYQTALISALILESTNMLYKNIPYHYRYVPDYFPDAWKDSLELNSWSLDEAYALQELKSWISEQNPSQPFFAHFLTGGSHYPYDVPNNFEPSQKTGNELERYRKSIRYADHILSQLIDFLTAQGKLENTIIALCGDHGEAFGNYHVGNHLHGNRLYEENIRNFLMILDFRFQKGPITSGKRGYIGDIAPTLLAYLPSGINMPGQNLFSKNYQTRIHFAHRDMGGNQWALSDGNWKFITPAGSCLGSELYDLSKDPDEQINLASQFPERLPVYYNLCSQWYGYAYQQFAAQFEGFEFSEHEMLPVDLLKPGPKALLVGYLGEDQILRKLDTINPTEWVHAYTRGMPFERDTQLLLEWISPNGKKWNSLIAYDSTQSLAWAPIPVDTPYETGLWKVHLAPSAANTNPLNTEFWVQTNTSHFFGNLENLIYRIDMGVKELNGDFVFQNVFQPTQIPSILLRCYPNPKNRQLMLRWFPPQTKNQAFQTELMLEKNWTSAWQTPILDKWVPGFWIVKIIDKESGKFLHQASFEIK